MLAPIKLMRKAGTPVSIRAEKLSNSIVSAPITTRQVAVFFSMKIAKISRSDPLKSSVSKFVLHFCYHAARGLYCGVVAQLLHIGKR